VLVAERAEPTRRAVGVEAAVRVVQDRFVLVVDDDLSVSLDQVDVAGAGCPETALGDPPLAVCIADADPVRAVLEDLDPRRRRGIRGGMGHQEGRGCCGSHDGDLAHTSPLVGVYRVPPKTVPVAGG
jgi:hypothetical protein